MYLSAFEERSQVRVIFVHISVLSVIRKQEIEIVQAERKQVRQTIRYIVSHRQAETCRP